MLEAVQDNSHHFLPEMIRGNQENSGQKNLPSTNSAANHYFRSPNSIIKDNTSPLNNHSEIGPKSRNTN